MAISTATALIGGAIIGGVASYQGAKKQAKTTEQLMREQMASDPFRQTQQQRYFDPLHETVTKGIGGTPYGEAITEATARKGASLGYNMSGNLLHDIAQGLERGTTERIQALTPLAMGRGESQAPMQAAPSILGAQQQQQRAGGYTLNEILRSLPTQQQTTTPTLLEQQAGRPAFDTNYGYL